MKHGKRIGEIAELTGLTVHALRQWHRRYGIGPTAVSQGGQRRYTEADTERIKLIQTLRHQGFSLATLAEWPVPKLRQNADQGNRRLLIGWYGPSYSRVAAQMPHAEILPSTSLVEWPSGLDLKILEVPTLTEEVVHSLPPGSNALLWYDFANRRLLRLLEEKGYETQRGRPEVRWLLERLGTGAAGFSTEELSRLMDIPTQNDCECPNHLARILKDLTGFAQYSLECSGHNTDQADLHRSLFDSIQSAQQAVLGALLTVAVADGITLPNLSESTQLAGQTRTDRVKRATEQVEQD